MAYKTWAFGEILTATDVNAYLMAQTVPRFATTGARSAAIASPATGQLTYVTGTGLQVWTGAAWSTITLVPPGGTTGQVLAKASGTDYDLTWVTP